VQPSISAVGYYDMSGFGVVGVEPMNRPDRLGQHIDRLITHTANSIQPVPDQAPNV